MKRKNQSALTVKNRKNNLYTLYSKIKVNGTWF